MTGAGIAIAPAGSADMGALEVLLAAQLDEHGIEIEPEKLARAIAGALEVPDRGSFLIARVGGEVVGVAWLSFIWALEHGGKSAWLDELYVVPTHRNAGVGTRLLSAACEHAIATGCAAIDLEVESDHARAAHLYERAGFRAHRRARWVLTLSR